jgi:hypothetical protein
MRRIVGQFAKAAVVSSCDEFGIDTFQVGRPLECEFWLGYTGGFLSGGWPAGCKSAAIGFVEIVRKVLLCPVLFVVV